VRTDIEGYLCLYRYFLERWPGVASELKRKAQSSVIDFVPVSKHLLALCPSTHVEVANLGRGLTVTTQVVKSDPGQCSLKLILGVETQRLELPEEAIRALFENGVALEAVSRRYKRLN